MPDKEPLGGEKEITKETLSQEARTFVEYYSGQLRDIFQEKEITSLNQVNPNLFTNEERERIEEYQGYIEHVLTKGKLPPEIAWGQKDLENKKDTARVYIGSLFKGFFNIIPEGVDIYTSFPPTQENKADIEYINLTIGGLNKGQLLEKLKQSGIRIGEDTRSMIQNKNFTTLQNPQEIKLIRLNVKDLGFNDIPTTGQIYAKAKKLGLELCPAEVGPHLTFKLSNQPNNDRPYLYIGMKQISNSNGPPLLGVFWGVFGLGRSDDGSLWLDGRWAGHHHDSWSSNSFFVFSLRK